MIEKKIVLRTDASVRMGDGVGLGFEAVIHNGTGKTSRICNNFYINDKIKTTEAETIAAVFAVKEILLEIGHDRGKYRLIIETDCEKTVDEVKKDNAEWNILQSLEVFAEAFNECSIRWISRGNNQRADSYAKNALERGEVVNG